MTLPEILMILASQTMCVCAAEELPQSRTIQVCHSQQYVHTLSFISDFVIVAQTSTSLVQAVRAATKSRCLPRSACVPH